MAKFVATGDWHIGARMGSAGSGAPRFREARFSTAERVVELAVKEGAAAIFLLGDTFDGDGVGSGDIRRTLELLARAPCEVFVLPGNHDWWHSGGVLSSFARLAADVANVSVLTAPKTPLKIDGLPGVTFFPCPVLKHAEVGDPTRWIPPRAAEDGVRVGLIHAALERADWGGEVPERVAEERNLDLALLGDWHKPVDGPDGRTFYPGSLEPLRFKDSHVGQVILAATGTEGAKVERVEVGKLAYQRIELTLESSEIGGVGPSVLADALAAITSVRENTAVRLHLFGKLTLTELDAFDRILAAQQGAGWATCDVQSEVVPLGEPDLDVFEEPAIRSVAEHIWEGDADAVLRRRALAILAEKVEATR